MFFETSARSAKNVQEIYLAVAKKLKQLKVAKVVIEEINNEKKVVVNNDENDFCNYSNYILYIYMCIQLF